MIPTAGVFSNRQEAERAMDLLTSRGIPADEMSLQPVRKPFWTNLVDLDIPTDEAMLYEPYVPGSAWMLLIKTSRLPMDQLDQIVEQERGLVVRAGVAPPLDDLPLRHSEEV